MGQIRKVTLPDHYRQAHHFQLISAFYGDLDITEQIRNAHLQTGLKRVGDILGMELFNITKVLHLKWNDKNDFNSIWEISLKYSTMDAYIIPGGMAPLYFWVTNGNADIVCNSLALNW